LLKTSKRLTSFKEEITSQKPFPGLQQSLKVQTKYLSLASNGLIDYDDEPLGFFNRKLMFKENVITGVTLHSRKLQHGEAYQMNIPSIFRQNTTISNNSYTLHVNMDLLNGDNIITTCFGSSSHHQVINVLTSSFYNYYLIHNYEFL
jgi:hypothetical protein